MINEESRQNKDNDTKLKEYENEDLNNGNSQSETILLTHSEPLYVSSINSFNSRKLLSISDNLKEKNMNKAELNDNLKSKLDIQKVTINEELKSKPVNTKAKLNKNLKNKPSITNNESGYDLEKKPDADMIKKPKVGYEFRYRISKYLDSLNNKQSDSLLTKNIDQENLSCFW